MSRIKGLTPYEEQHLALLKDMVFQLTRIADAIQGDVLEPEEVYSEETLNQLRQACNAAVPPGVVRNLEEELQAFNFTHQLKRKTKEDYIYEQYGKNYKKKNEERNTPRDLS